MRVQGSEEEAMNAALLPKPLNPPWKVWLGSVLVLYLLQLVLGVLNGSFAGHTSQ